MTTEYKVISIDKLQPFLIRGIRPDVIAKLKERISQGFNPARPLTVIQQNGHYIVADGNHRLQTLNELGIKEVPVVIRDGDPYWLAIQGNTDEDAYAPMDLFDWLDVIKSMPGTQEDKAKRIGWSRQQISQYQMLIENIATDILEITKDKQKGRVAENATGVAFEFTEYWFRTSGLYDLLPKYQEQLIKAFIADKFNWRKEKVQQESAKYKQWQLFIKIAESELVNLDDLPCIIQLVENNTFKNEAQLRLKITDLNSKAQNKLICGDAIAELEKLPDANLDVIITDPPYGIDYISNHSKYDDYITKEGIAGDSTLTNALETLDKTLKILFRKTKPDAHIYIFTSWKTYNPVSQIISQYFNIKNMIVWDKGNWTAGDLTGRWGNQHELIIFATKGQRPVNKRRGDIVSCPRIPTINSIHQTQKPVDLIKELLAISAQKADSICDPFMGSGTTIKAIKEYDKSIHYTGIEIDRAMFEKARSFIGD